MTNTQRNEIQYLLLRYINGETSSLEETRLFALLEKQEDPTLAESILEELMSAEQEDGLYNKEEWAIVINNILGDRKVKIPVKRIGLWKRIAVAASIALIIGTGYWVLSDKKSTVPDLTAQTDTVKAPEKNRAVITLVNGKKVYLDSVKNGTLLQQDGVEIVKQADGKIIYNGSTEQLIYNTLTNPRGSKVIDMTLADGSRVWLNAGSSVTYPVAFVANERKVSINGEAYFEIAHDKSKPFIVSANNKVDVTVLGTHFNVNAYDDERDIKVTLLEGSVKVSNDIDSKTIKPGEQAAADTHSPLTIDHSPDLEQVMAWKNGLFSFNKADIQTVMKQISRWYAIDVIYEGAIPLMQFGGELERNLNLSQVLKALEKSKVHFRITGNTVVVLQ